MRKIKRLLLLATLGAGLVLTPSKADASCTTQYFECGWFDENCEPCMANAIVRICNGQITIIVVGCCICA